MGGAGSKSQDNRKINIDKNSNLDSDVMRTEYFYNKKHTVNIFIFLCIYIILFIALYSLFFIHHSSIIKK